MWIILGLLGLLELADINDKMGKTPEQIQMEQQQAAESAKQVVDGFKQMAVDTSQNPFHSAPVQFMLFLAITLSVLGLASFAVMKVKSMLEESLR